MGSTSIETDLLYTLIDHLEYIYTHAFYPGVKAIALQALQDFPDDLGHMLMLSIDDKELRTELKLDEDSDDS